ncbi:ABC transporter ATP-binding protein [Xylanimonas allomyrinae]|uniref:ABC transporter ATP-binding protein n=1 Tax=Xylanimonas allomyrinae TaxID=2509459 RepID=A0A4P6EKZ9_9MICO|nr:ABC transporter ATP-binding protein [Xylanimonas allomyrinae]QAY61979.1 ABC transporter ATP-binding protein [Xylanimonas allomyrinae]
MSASSHAPVPGAGPLLSLRSVTKQFEVRTSRRWLTAPSVLTAVDGVDLDLARGETFGLVGESGSGKSTLGRLAVRLAEPTRGSITFDGRDISHLHGAGLRTVRRRMQVVFQDPLGSLDPRMRVGEIVGEPLRVFEGLRGATLDDRVAELLRSVGLDPARARARPRALSGGQRQRVGIARAVALGPELILADEPVSALDVSVQAQIVNLLAELRETLGLTYLFIAHGLPVVRQLAQRVGVMYLGRIVESAPVDELFANPRHPYTQALLAASPVPDPGRRRERAVLQGEPPSPLRVPSGCRFRTRCPVAMAICAAEEPPVAQVGLGHQAQCHRAEAGT